jgi:hypothetical protein
MPKTQTSKKSKSSGTNLRKQAAIFFGSLAGDADGRRLLAEQDHCVEFDLKGGEAFRVQVKRGKIQVKPGTAKPQRYDVNDLIHFQLRAETLARLFAGKIRFTDSLIPTGDGSDAMLLLECTLFKWSVLSWVGRLFRGAQLRTIGSL